MLVKIKKVKKGLRMSSVGEMLVSFLLCFELLGGYRPLVSVTHNEFDPELTVTFPGSQLRSVITF